jgi:hypothetical protein
MPWDMNKCRWGVPIPFTNVDAANAVAGANFTASVYVNTSAKDGKTRQAFTYVEVRGYRICVVGHIHPQPSGPPVAGNAYIPGWMAWETTTPLAAVTVINGLPDGGTFPGDNRYPHPVL